jgi:hypothetical protein
MFCTGCGFGLEDGAAFCGKCGRRADQAMNGVGHTTGGPPWTDPMPNPSTPSRRPLLLASRHRRLIALVAVAVVVVAALAVGAVVGLRDTGSPSGSDLLHPQCVGGAACVTTADGLTIFVVQSPYRQYCSPCGGIPGLNVEIYLRFTYAGSGSTTTTVDDENDGNGSWALVDNATGGRIIQWDDDLLYGCIGADQQAQAAGIGGTLEDELLALPGMSDCFSATLQNGTCFTAPIPMVWFIEGGC